MPRTSGRRADDAAVGDRACGSGRRSSRQHAAVGTSGSPVPTGARFYPDARIRPRRLRNVARCWS
jgi:hypothetical protein